MKLILKNLRQAEFEIEVESNLIILDDSKSLKQYSIDENCTIIMMTTKKRKCKIILKLIITIRISITI